MVTNPAPPKLGQRFAEAWLPPNRREQVLGDLEERFLLLLRTRSPLLAQWQYLLDAFTIVPAVFWSQRGQWRIGAGVPPRLQVGAGVETVRGQVEAFQQENYCRFLFYAGMITVISTMVLATMTTRDNWQVWFLRTVFIALQLFTVYQHGCRGDARVVPGCASLSDLVTFHQRELARRRHFLRTLWYWKWLPLVAPFLVVAALRPAKVSLAAILCFASGWIAAFLAARSQARGLQEQIGDLGRLQSIARD